jgi:uncharacterized membrane protein
MQQVTQTSGRSSMSEIARVLFGIGLFILVIGLWVSLWVPPTPTF